MEDDGTGSSRKDLDQIRFIQFSRTLPFNLYIIYLICYLMINYNSSYFYEIYLLIRYFKDEIIIFEYLSLSFF